MMHVIPRRLQNPPLSPFQKRGIFLQAAFNYSSPIVLPLFEKTLKKGGQGRFVWVEGRIVRCGTVSERRNEVKEGTVARSFVQITECLVGSDLAAPNSDCRASVRRG